RAARSDGHCSGVRINPQHVQWERRRDAKALALADGEPMDAAVRAELGPPLIDNRSRARDRRLLTLDECCVVMIRNEADLLAIRLLSDRKAKASRLIAHF